MREESRSSLGDRLRGVAGVLLCLSLVLQVSPGSAGPQQTKEELEEAKKRAEQLTDDLRAAQQRRDELQVEIVAITQRIAGLTAQVETLRTAIAEVRKAIRKANREIGSLQESLDDRARTAYINGPGTVVELVLESDSLANLSDRLGFLGVLQREDTDLAVGIQTEKAQLEEYSLNLASYEEEKRTLLSELRPQQAQLRAAWAEQEELIAQSKEDREEALDLVGRLQERYQAQLQAVLSTTSRPVTQSGPPVNADGPLYWCPVDAPRSYVDTFGAPRPGGRTHQGNDMFAAAGTPIRAPFAGHADEGYNSLGGYTVNVYSPNGDYVYNAHMSRYAGVDGQQVQPGDLIGYVGNTGNAIGTSPHDHFEYHPGGGSAVSPYLYLNEVCGVNGSR